MPTDWKPTYLLLTCEHGGRDLPPGHAHRFDEQTLASHRGYDPGALDIAMRMAATLAVPLIHATTSRLLVELNRSIDHPQAFADATLTADERAEITATYYTPYRTSVERTIAMAVSAGHRVLHLGVHSFTDVLDGHERHLDLGLLYDPDRPSEHAFCTRWATALREHSPLRTVFNQPYLGTDDGLTTTLRRQFDQHHYAGVEIEVRQGLATTDPTIADLLTTTLQACGGGV